MIALGELLHMYIKQSGYTVYSIAYCSKINRTTLQKALSGERPLSRANLDKLIPFLKLTPKEHKTLEKAYTIASLGETTYRKHYYIKELVENIEIHDHGTDDALLATAPPQPLSLEKAVNIKGMCNILSTVKRLADALIADCDTPYLHVISKFSGSFFVSLYNQLRHPYYKNLEIIHIIPFVKNTGIASGSLLYNLEELSALLPFSLSAESNCVFHYFYEIDNISAFSSLPYASYILLNHNVILISSDYQDALILPEACASNFRNNFSDILKTSSLLLDTISNPGLLFSAAKDSTDFHFSHSIDMQPMARLIANRRDELNRLSESCMVFPYQGFQDFAKKGILYEVPSEIGRPLSREERISILKQMIEMNKEGVHKFFLLKEDGFQPKLYVLTYDASAIVFYYKKSDYEYQICSLYEPSIIQEMNDFISNAAIHDFSYSLTESNEIFEQTILQLERTG